MAKVSSPSATRPTRPQKAKAATTKRSAYSARIRDFKCRRIYHIFQRGNLGRRVFLSEHERGNYLEHLFFLALRYNVKVHNFCLMPTHIHFVLEQREKHGISNLMRELQSTHARLQNVRRDTFGNLWTQHFGCKHVNTDAYFRTLMWYLGNNPVKSGKVLKASDYRWSGAQVYAAGGPVTIHFDGRHITISLHMEQFEKVCKSEQWQATLQRDEVEKVMPDECKKIEEIFDAKTRRQFALEERVRDANARKEQARKARQNRKNRARMSASNPPTQSPTQPASQTQIVPPKQPPKKQTQRSLGTMRAG